MSVFLVLIPISLGLAVLFVLLCLASIRDGQFDDLESPRWRVLFERGEFGESGESDKHGASAIRGVSGGIALAIAPIKHLPPNLPIPEDGK
ncbi:MAG: cbb3-type cytochrome oxidase assembly protein CcoS [Fibrobacteria bacterium]